MSKPIGCTMCRRQPVAAAVRPIAPVLFGISGCSSTIWKRGRLETGRRLADGALTAGVWPPLIATALAVVAAGLAVRLRVLSAPGRDRGATRRPRPAAAT